MSKIKILRAATHFFTYTTTTLGKAGASLPRSSSNSSSHSHSRRRQKEGRQSDISSIIQQPVTYKGAVG